MSRKLIDLTGTQFNLLTVIKRFGKYKGESLWTCLCVCGDTTVMRSSQIKNATYLSCGCAKLNNSTKHVRHNESVHGGNHSKEYKTWQCIKQRCASQIRYISKGIKMCDEWAKSYESFLAYVGRAPTHAHTMDRIDNTKGYEPGNVRWATMKEQQRNRSDNRLITYKGKTQSMAAWAEELGINYSTLQSRLRRGSILAG